MHYAAAPHFFLRCLFGKKSMYCVCRPVLGNLYENCKEHVQILSRNKFGPEGFLLSFQGARGAARHGGYRLRFPQGASGQVRPKVHPRFPARFPIFSGRLPVYYTILYLKSHLGPLQGPMAVFWPHKGHTGVPQVFLGPHWASL